MHKKGLFTSGFQKPEAFTEAPRRHALVGHTPVVGSTNIRDEYPLEQVRIRT